VGHDNKQARRVLSARWTCVVEMSVGSLLLSIDMPQRREMLCMERGGKPTFSDPTLGCALREYIVDACLRLVLCGCYISVFLDHISLSSLTKDLRSYVQYQ
jgi:hypothetical protein